MRLHNRLLAALLLAGAAVSPSAAQEQGPEVGAFIFRAETRLVVLHATVVDRDKR